jgi:hypothetical protein
VLVALPARVCLAGPHGRNSCHSQLNKLSSSFSLYSLGADPIENTISNSSFIVLCVPLVEETSCHMLFTGRCLAADGFSYWAIPSSSNLCLVLSCGLFLPNKTLNAFNMTLIMSGEEYRVRSSLLCAPSRTYFLKIIPITDKKLNCIWQHVFAGPG